MEGYYKTIELDAYNGELRLKERSFRNLHRFEVLVKIKCTTINPVDLLFMKGIYGETKPHLFPIIPGIEGSGEIIKVGDDIDKKYVGKRVAVFEDYNRPGTFEGIWAEYHYTTLTNLMIYDKDLPYERICFIMNPLTAVGMLDTCLKQKVDGVLQTAASSTVGRMFIRLCDRYEIQLVNLVRDDQSALKLKQIAAQNIIKTSDKNWESECVKMCTQMKIQMCYDCVGGEITSKVINCMPNGSTIYHYGNLLGKEIEKIDSGELIFKDKTLSGWWLHRWLQSLSEIEIKYWWGFIKDEIQSNSNLFATQVSKEFKLDDIAKAIEYYHNYSSAGKVLLKSFSS
jgi:NADPH:quinone reductase